MSDIRMVTPIKSVEKFFEKAADILYHGIMYNLSYLGELCVKKVRDRTGNESWFDQTGNLRSSIGYAIYSHGRKTMESAFGSVLQGQEGSQKGRKMIEELATKYSDTYALVVIAAMEYAEFVEAIETKDVLASTELYARAEVGRYLDKAIKDAEKDIQKLEYMI